jgi:cytochrome c-type biogenesis protein CcmH
MMNSKLVKQWFLAAVLALAALGAEARIEVHEFADAQQEADYKQLIEELRCLVCQNQNLADSNAELAQDLRREVYEMLRQGKSREQIIDFMVARYGDFVLYRPPVKSTTMLLWAGPFLFMAGGIAGLVVLIRRNSRRAAPASELSAEDHEKARRLLAESEKKDS